MEAKHYILTRTGLEILEKTKEFPIGLKIYAFGAGMSDSVYCVTSLRDQRGLQEVSLVTKYHEGDYFSPITTIDERTRPVSKKYGIGFYWDDKENFIYPKDAVERIKAKAQRETHEIELRVLAKKEADRKEQAELPAKYPHLKPYPKNYNELRANIMADLKHSFPNRKFSIKKWGHDAIYIRWEDGLKAKEVEDSKYKWIDHKTDFTGDYRDYCPSNFNRVFGGINYIFTERSKSSEVEKLIEDLKEMRDWVERDLYQTFHEIFCKTSFPPVYENLRIERTEMMSGQLHDLYKIAYDVPEKVTPTKIEVSGVEIIDYSEKAIAVIGDTKPIKDQLKELGGRFNSRLTCGAGWIFPKTKREEVELLLIK